MNESQSGSKVGLAAVMLLIGAAVGAAGMYFAKPKVKLFSTSSPTILSYVYASGAGTLTFKVTGITGSATVHVRVYGCGEQTDGSWQNADHVVTFNNVTNNQTLTGSNANWSSDADNYIAVFWISYDAYQRVPIIVNDDHSVHCHDEGGSSEHQAVRVPDEDQ